jgi:DNA-binding CsgD family transcriptional regulator
MLTGTIDLPALVANFYEAAFDASRWTQGWRQLAGYLQASAGTLFVEDTAARARRVVVGINVGLTSLEGFPPAFGLSDEKMRHAYEHFAIEQLGAADVLLSLFEIGRGRRLVAAFHRAGDGAGFDSTDARLLDGVIAHLAGAYRQMERMEQARDRADHHLMVLENLPYGTILLGVDGAVLYANVAANRLCGPEGLLLFNTLRGVEAHQPAENIRLQSLIQGVRAGEEGGILRITRSPPQTSLALRVDRLPAVAGEAGHRALLVLRDLSRRPAARGAQVRELFGLTTAESEVLDELLDGLTARAIAEKRSVSLYTVQAQVRHILAKTGAEKMRDLVRMMASLFG